MMSLNCPQKLPNIGLCKEQVVNHPDFLAIVVYSIREQSMRFRLKMLGLSDEEFAHEVMTHIWLRGGNNEKLHTLTTTITKHCQWTLIKLLRAHYDRPCSISDIQFDNIVSRENLDINESAGLLDKAISKAYLTPDEKTVIRFLSEDVSLTQIPQKMGISFEKVKTIHHRVLKKIRRANPNGEY